MTDPAAVCPGCGAVRDGDALQTACGCGWGAGAADPAPAEGPCPICGGADYTWGVLQGGPNIQFDLRARRCGSCGNVQLFG